MASPEEIVQRQLVAFNAHDLEPFLALFAPGVTIVDLVDGSLVLRGIEALRDRYVAVFRDRPLVRAELVGRLALGRFVIDRERLTDGDAQPAEDALAIYEVEDDVVTRMWFIEPEHRRVRPG
jgi:hypothetical protein